MLRHVAHHYLPKFLLSKWHSGPDQKLSSFRFAADGVHHSRFRAKSVAKVDHLYSAGLSRNRPDVSIESDFLGPIVDDPGAKLHAKILREGLESLQENEFEAFGNFLVSLIVRGPGAIGDLRRRGDELVQEILTNPGQEILEKFGVDLHERIAEKVLREQPHRLEDMGIKSLPLLIRSPVLNAHFLGAKSWLLLDFSRAQNDLLIGDNPVFLKAGAKRIERKFEFIAVPMSPRHALFISEFPDNLLALEQKPRNVLVRELNTHAIVRAEQYVYATDNSLYRLVKKKSRDRPREARGPWARRLPLGSDT